MTSKSLWGICAWIVLVSVCVLAVVILAPPSASGQSMPAEDTYYLRKGDVVMWLGDQMTADEYFAAIFNDDMRKDYPDLVLGKDGKVAKDYDGPGIKFVNAGGRGDTTVDGAKNVNDLVDKIRPTVAVVCYSHDIIKGRDKYQANLRSIVQKLKARKVDVTVLSAPCVSTLNRPQMEKYVSVLAEMADEARKVALEEGVGFADSYKITRAYIEDPKTKNQDFTIDGRLPNKHLGQRLICNALEDVWGLGKPLAKEGQARVRPWPSDKDKSSLTPTPTPTPSAGATPTPAPIDIAARHEMEWINCTTNIGGGKWGLGGVVLLTGVPGREDMVAGVADAGLWASNNGGANWRHLGGGRENKDQPRTIPSQILFDPKDATKFWVTCATGPGIYRSSDMGRTFERVGTLENVTDLSVDFRDALRLTMLAGQADTPKGLQKSIDGGKTWLGTGSGLPDKTSPNTNPILLDDKTFLTNSVGAKLDLTFGIFRSEDGGKVWRKMADYGTVGKPLRSSDGAIYWAQIWSQGLVKSVDNGKTWTALDGVIKKTPIDMPGGVLLSVAGSQLYFSVDGAKTWKEVGPKIPITPTGFVYSEGRTGMVGNSVYVWYSSGDHKVDDAVWRLDLPSDLRTIFVKPAAEPGK